LPKAFNGINHTLLLKQISNSAINSNVVRWIATWLRGRQASCLYQSAKSKSCKIHTGVPQGSVLSPSLFNTFVSNCPEFAELLASFANNFTVGESAVFLPDLATSLSEDLFQISDWARDKQLKIAPDKAKMILFTPDPAQSKHHPKVLLDRTYIPLNKAMKILGVTWDTHFNFSAHICEIVAKAVQRLLILKAIAGQAWGQCKAMLLATY
jgi:hypothetical protein